MGPLHKLLVTILWLLTLSENSDVVIGMVCLDDNERLDGFNHLVSQWATLLDIIVFNPDLYHSLK